MDRRGYGQTGDTIAGVGSALAEPVSSVAKRLSEERREFQLQELMLAKSSGWIFKPGETPRVLWRDIDTVRRLGCNEPLRVRWFNAELKESSAPNALGRWVAWIEGTAPNGTPLQRLRTFYAIPEQTPTSIMPKLTVALPNLSSSEVPAVIREHEAEIVRLANDALLRTLMGNEQGAILVAGLTEIEALGRPATYIESSVVRNDDVNLALKLKLQGLHDKVRSLRPPQHLDSSSPRLREGSFSDAGVAADAKARIDAMCRE